MQILNNRNTHIERLHYLTDQEHIKYTVEEKLNKGAKPNITSLTITYMWGVKLCFGKLVFDT